MSFGLAVGYIATLTTVYYFFVKWYYNRAASLHPSRLSTPWFSTPHVTKEAYVTYYDGIDNDPLTQDQIKQLKTLLMRRTMTNVERVFALREDRTALSLLVSQGSIGDHLWHEFLEAEHEIDQEISSCVQEAELLQPGWSKLIFPQAAQLIAREREKEAAEQLKKLTQLKSLDDATDPSLYVQRQYRERLEKELIDQEEKEKKALLENKQQGTKSKNKSKK